MMNHKNGTSRARTDVSEVSICYFWYSNFSCLEQIILNIFKKICVLSMLQEFETEEAGRATNARNGGCESYNLSLILPSSSLNNLVQTWLSEDLPSFDYSGTVVGNRKEKALLLCKSPGVLAGCPFFDAVFEHLNCRVKWLFSEGDQLSPVCTVAEVSGEVNRILIGERVALNCITRASGVATKARRLADLKRT